MKKVNRQNSGQRSAKEGEVEDTLAVFAKLDKIEARDRPIFCTTDVTGLPLVSPEQGGCVMSLMESMSMMSKQLQELQDTVGNVKCIVDSHEKKLSAVKEPVPSSGGQEGRGGQSNHRYSTRQPC